MSKTKIEIEFPVPVALPDGWERVLDSLVNMVCEQYERENPDRVMWPAGQGCKPMLDEPHEPKFDDAVYYVDVAERQDLHGRNPHNPNRERLRAEAVEIRKARKKGKQSFVDGFIRLSKTGSKEELAEYLRKNSYGNT